MAGVVRDRFEMVEVTGPDALTFLDGLLSQDLTELHPQMAVRSFLLSPQGKLRALLWVGGQKEQLALYANRGIGARVAADLAHYKIRVKAKIAEPVPAFAFLDEFPEEAVAAQLGERKLGLGVDDPGWDELDSEVWEEARINAGEPVMDRDVDEKTIPQETGLVGEAVSFSKGCYLGQELVARLDSRQGRVNRNLRRVALDSSVPTPTPVFAAGEEVGQLTSVAVRKGRAIGLGLLHRSVEPGDKVAIGDHTGEVLGP